MDHARFEVYRSDGVAEAASSVQSQSDFERVRAMPQEWRWRLRAANGEIVASGEAYSSRRDAFRAAATVVDLAAEADIHTVGS